MKVWIVKNEKTSTAAIPTDIGDAIERHGCVIPPEYFPALAEFPDMNAYHQRCLVAKANCVAGLGYEFTEKVPKELEDFLLENSFAETIINFWYDYELFGNSYMEIVRLSGRLAALYHLPAKDIYVTKYRDACWQLMPDGKEVRFAVYGEKDNDNHEVLGIKNYTPRSGYYGLPQYLGALPAITINRVIGDYNLNFFSNSAIPDLALIVEGGELDEKSEEEIKTFLSDNIKGIANAHKTLYIPVTDPNVKIRIEKLNNVRDASFRGLRNDNRDEIISAHGVPPRLVGVVVSGQLGGSGEVLGQLQTFLQTDIRPKQRKLENFLNKFFENEFGTNPGIKFKELDITTALEDAQMHQIYGGLGIMRTDEIRERINLPPMTQKAKEENLLKTLQEIRKSILGNGSEKLKG